MSTSPSWFDQDKFSRLVKKVGPKTAAVQPAASQPVPEKKAPSQPLVKEASLPPEEKPSQPAPKTPPIEPPGEATRLSQRLPKIEPPTPEPEPDIIPAPIRAEAGALPTEIEEEAPALPEPVSRPQTSVQRMMTSQPLSLGKKSTPPALPSSAPRTEPIRAPEPSVSKTPPLPEGTPAPGLPRRTQTLPALKSLFQYEIPGGQGTIQGKPVPQPPAPKPPLPTFSFPKPEAKAAAEIPPPTQDEEEEVPSFAGISDAGHLAEEAEPEEISADSLAADWGKIDELNEELVRVTKERDDALAEGDALLQQLREVQEAAPENGAADSDELEQVIRERDEMRGEYMKLREAFENLKQDQLQPQEESGGGNAELEQEIESLREQLAEKDAEINKIKIASTGTDDVVATLKEELNVLRDEVKKAKDETSAAQRGLALSQKALQDTREALKK